jgi:peptidylprolyl isomerase/FKBP-type peptidyl-prolyl cis-trans isomerase FkpA
MKNKYLLVTVFLVVLVAVGGYFVYRIPSQNSSDSVNMDTANTNMNDQLGIIDEVVGTGAEAVSGKHVTVNYTGTLTDGTKFDSSLNPGRTPFDFNLGAGEVIAGWDQGVVGMKVGGKRKLTIPPSLGYGSQAQGPIPANSTLIFEVELFKVE